MMYFNKFNIPDNIDTINVVGEIKNHKNQNLNKINMNYL